MSLTESVGLVVIVPTRAEDVRPTASTATMLKVYVVAGCRFTIERAFGGGTTVKVVGERPAGVTVTTNLATLPTGFGSVQPATISLI